MQHSLAIFEDEQDAIRTLIQEIGGFKVVGHSLRPDLTPDRAGNWLRDCMNPERAERLQPSQLFHLLKMGREKGSHSATEFILRNIGYAVTPLEPEDEKARLQREYIEAVSVLRRLTDQIGKVVQ